MPYTDDVLSRFWDKTTTDHDLWFNGTKCIIWTASAATKGGYGRFRGDEKFWVAHQFAYALEHGLVPDGAVVTQLCRRPKCVNHQHLEAVTPCEARRRAERRRVYQLTCPAGHLWTRETLQKNTNSKGDTCRRCAQCNRDRMARFYKKGGVVAKRTLEDLSPVCRNNHPRTRMNTRFDKYGVAVCRDCQREAGRRYAQNRAAV